ncbi:MAG: hypothetical protein K6G25_04790 [Bacteroidales bacterium]|nr:hypothetical protein [Bacteroidales bacterium]
MATNNNIPNVQQLMGKGGCLKKILLIAAVLFVAYYLMKSCGGGLLNYGNDTSQESTTTSSSDNNTITMPDLTPTNTESDANTNTTSNAGDYSWIVGTWDCEMGAYGKMVMNFEGDGASGRCSELKSDGTYRYGTYHVDGNVLSYKLTGESFSTTIDIEPGHKLSAGDGVYFRKRN